MATANTEVKKSNESGDTSAPMGSRKATTKEQLANNQNELAVLGQKLVSKSATPQDYIDMMNLAQSTQKLQAEHDKFRSTHAANVSAAGLDPEDVFSPEAIKASYQKLFPSAVAAAPKGPKTPKAPKAEGSTSGFVKTEENLFIKGYKFDQTTRGAGVIWHVGQPFQAKMPGSFEQLGKTHKTDAELKKAIEAIVTPAKKEFVKTPEGQHEVDMLVAYITGKHPTRAKALAAIPAPAAK